MVYNGAGDLVVLSTAEARQFISSGHAEEIKMDPKPLSKKAVEKVAKR